MPSLSSSSLPVSSRNLAMPHISLQAASAVAIGLATRPVTPVTSIFLLLSNVTPDSSERRVSAVHLDRKAGDIGRLIRQEPDDRLGYLVGIPVPFHRPHAARRLELLIGLDARTA